MSRYLPHMSPYLPQHVPLTPPIVRLGELVWMPNLSKLKVEAEEGRHEKERIAEDRYGGCPVLLTPRSSAAIRYFPARWPVVSL